MDGFQRCANGCVLPLQHSRCLVRLQWLASCVRLPLLRAELPALYFGCSSASSRLHSPCLLPPLTAQIAFSAPRVLLQLNSGGKASGACSESVGVAPLFDIPACPGSVVVREAGCDATQGSHIQRSPLSMGAFGFAWRSVAHVRSPNTNNNAEINRRNVRHSESKTRATLGTSLPIHE